VYAESSEVLETTCPTCGARATLREVIYELPSIGKALLVSMSCPHCGYRRSDVIPLQIRSRRRIYYRVEDPEDLYAKVVRSSVASIEIPQLGVSITPGIAGQFTVTNVEGVLRMVQDAAKSIEVLEGRGTDFVEAVERIVREGGHFTLIIDDPWGISCIEPILSGGRCKVLIEIVEGEAPSAKTP